MVARFVTGRAATAVVPPWPTLRPNATVRAALMLASIGLAVGLSGCSDASTSSSGSKTTSDQASRALGTELARALGTSTDGSAYWEGYVTSYSGSYCQNEQPISVGPSNSTNYAGSIWLSSGKLYASPVELSGNFEGTLSRDGSFHLATAPYPDEPDSVDAHVISKHGSEFVVAGTFSNDWLGNCVLTYRITSGYITPAS